MAGVVSRLVQFQPAELATGNSGKPVHGRTGRADAHSRAFLSVDFDGLNEGWLWEDFEVINKRHPDVQPNHYRKSLERRFRELETGSP
jgi:hypothetical protein